MAIVKMNKFTLLTFESYKEPLLKELQKFENIQFKDLQQTEDRLEFLKKEAFAENVSKIESELSKIKFTLDKITPFADKPSGLKAMSTPKPTISFTDFDSYTQNYDYQSIYESVKEADEKLKSLKSEKERLRAENQNLSSWLRMDVSLEAMDRLKSVRYLVGTINQIMADSFRETLESSFSCCYVEFFGVVKEDAAVMVVIPADQFEDISAAAKNAGFTRAVLNFQEVPGNLIQANNARIQEIEQEQAELSEKNKQYGSEYASLAIVMDYFQTELARAEANSNFLKMETVVLMEGWVPQENSAAFNGILTSVCKSDYYLEETEVEKESLEVPIKLKNGLFSSAFEDITAMYSLPTYGGLDPTPVMAPFYWAFFGLMVGDTGYGLLLLIATAFALKCLHLGKGVRNFVKFLFALSFSTMLAGALYGSFFGFPYLQIRMGPEGPQSLLSTESDIVTMLILSIGVGVVQIVFGLLVKGYVSIRDGKLLDAIFDSLFYILAVLSGIALIVYAAGMIPASYSPILWGVFLFSLVGLAATQGRSSPSLGGKIGNGLYSVYGLTSYVGDLVSYTRLVALALSGAYIAYSFNLIAGIVAEGMEGAGIVSVVLLGIGTALIFVIGQALNLGLAVLGAYVHSCRLQYVEYFSKFYDGGGKKFNPFQMKNKHVDIQ